MAEGSQGPFLRETVPFHCVVEASKPPARTVPPPRGRGAGRGRLGRPPHQLLLTSAAEPGGAKASIPGQERGAPDVEHEGVEHRGGP